MFEHDVLITTETWLTNHIAGAFRFPIKGYMHFFSCRDSKKEHGGISVFVKDKIKAEVVDKQSNPDLLALSLGTRQILLIAVYASPRNSRNSDINVFEDIANLITKAAQHDHVIVMGDLNAHVGELNRCSSPTDYMHIANLIARDEDEVPVHPRHSKDKRVDVRGRECIQFCEQLGFDIVNGCQGLGDDEGEVTWESTNGRDDTGVLDLCLASHEFFTAFRSFKVAGYTGLTDHRLISCTVNVAPDVFQPKTSEKHRVPAWIQKEWERYARKAQAALPKIETLLQGVKDTLDIEDIDTRSSKVCKLLQNCARDAFQQGKVPHCDESSRSKVTRGQISVVWWDHDCEIARSRMAVERDRCYCEGLKSDQALRDATRRFKHVIKKKRREAELKADMELVDWLKRDPWMFWSKIRDKRQLSTLPDPEEAANYFQGLLNCSEVGDSTEPNVEGDARDAQPRVAHKGISVENLDLLNSSITTQEVISALRKLRNGRSSADGYRAELFKYVKLWNEENKRFEYPMAQCLADLFNACFLRQQGIPSSWRKAFIIPIHKGNGPRDSLDHHRGISVLSSLYKLYCSILYARLDNACEKEGIRAESQCGFRKKMGTISAAFALQYAIYATCSAKSEGGLELPLFVSFVDFQKAFDSLLRPLIWKRLRILGLNGNILHAIMDFYKDTAFQVKINGKISDQKVTSTTGVKQGCPLSPLLFGLFIEQLDGILGEIEGAFGISISGHDLRDLLYADDAALMATSVNGLQSLVSSLYDFSTRNCMKVNTNKTEVMAFVPQKSESISPEVYYDSNTLPITTEFKYLGIHVHNKKWLAMAGEKIAEKAGKAMWALCMKMEGLGIKCMEVKLRLFDMLVMSIGNYGCQIWGVHYLRFDSDAHVFNNPLQKLVLLFLRTISGAYRNTSRWVLLKEFGLLPTQVTWACFCARWWNKCLDGHQGNLMQKILQHDVELFRRGNDKCWSAKLLVCMGRLQLLSDNSVSMLRTIPVEEVCALRFSESSIKEAFVAQYERLQNVSDSDPRIAPSPGLALLKHTQWFATEDMRHLKFSAPAWHLKTLHKFRLGSLQLRCYDHTIQPRDARVCTLCSQQNIEDEKHLIFECEAYESLRRDSRWVSLFSVAPSHDMKAFMSHSDQEKLCAFINNLLHFRSRCIQLGQVAVPLLPVVQASSQMDLFESSSSDCDEPS